MNNYQILHYHITQPVSQITFLEVSDAANFVDEANVNTEELEGRINELLNFLKKKNEVLVYFSTSFLDHLSKDLPSTLDNIKSYVDKGQIKLVASCAYHSLSFLCHPELFKKEIAFHKESYKKYFGQQSDLFINTACLFNDQLIESLGNEGFSSIVAPSNSWHLSGLKSADVYQSVGNSPLKIILSNGDSSSTIYVGLANGFGSGYNDKEILTSNLKELDKKLSGKSKLETYSASMPLSSPEWSHPLAIYLATALQKALFNECRRLIDKTHDRLGDEDWKVLMHLCQPDLLIRLNTNQSNNGFPHFINCMNVLTAIGLKYRN